ncbi:MAG: beta-lactamase family protein [Bacteroidales bacterium]|nr:beta-lactamase family protein [Bacteroidales bacterium]
MRILIILFVLLLSFTCSAQNNSKVKEQKLDSLMKTVLIHKGKQPVHNFLIYLKNEKNGFEFCHGVGIIGRNDTMIDEQYQYNVASITKTFVATIILQLEEEGKLNIKDKAINYIGHMNFLNFDEILILDKTPRGKEITIEMLLNHTSGIPDIFSDAATRFNLSVLLHKKRQYTPQKLIRLYYKYKMNKKAFNRPREGYHYSDINYMILGYIIEQITKQSLPEAIRKRILIPLNMENTYFEFYETVHGKGKRIDAFLNRINITKKINTSYEWAGGGLVSTTKDLGVFIESLFGLELFENKATLEKMINTTATEKYGANYGLGILKYDLNSKTFYGHGGFYGSLLIYDPKKGITLSANIGQANAPFDAEKLVNDILNIIDE